MTALNKKQKQAAQQIDQFILQNTSPFFYLLGYAGTGKTYLIGSIIKNLLLNNQIDQIYVCAPTHQALNVIESSIRSNIVQLNDENKLVFMTIHKLLDFKPIIMTNDGSKIFKSIKESKFLKQIKSKLIVIDECSMISKLMVIELKKYAELYPIKIIFMGDRKQLPPIGEPESLVFTDIPRNYQHQILLDEIMRTKSPEIKEVCRIIRTWNRQDDLIKLLLPIHNRKTRAFKMYHKKSNYVESNWFKYTINKLDQKQIPIILPWRNETVNFYNNIIRNYLYKGADLTNFVVGDYVIFNNFHCSLELEYFYTSNMVEILEIAEKEDILFDWHQLIILNAKTKIDASYNTLIKKFMSQKNKFKINIFSIRRCNSEKITDMNKKYSIQAISRVDLASYELMINNIKEHIEYFFSEFHSTIMTNKLWKAYHTKLIDPFAQIKLGYSTTIYKAQGSTFPNAIVDFDDLINLNINEFQLALYTAAGRAGDELRFIVPEKNS